MMRMERATVAAPVDIVEVCELMFPLGRVLERGR